MKLKMYVVIEKSKKNSNDKKCKKYNFSFPKTLFGNDLKLCKINIFENVF